MGTHWGVHGDTLGGAIGDHGGPRGHHEADHGDEIGTIARKYVG
jgi:hypothetical protein